jgi:hypothetical protein
VDLPYSGVPNRNEQAKEWIGSHHDKADGNIKNSCFYSVLCDEFWEVPKAAAPFISSFGVYVLCDALYVRVLAPSSASMGCLGNL